MRRREERPAHEVDGVGLGRHVSEEVDELIINIFADGRIVVSGRDVAPDNLLSELKAAALADPQTPVTPVDEVAASKPGSSDHMSMPITFTRGSNVSGSMRTLSIAPGAARWPHVISAPSNAGPVGEEAATRCFLFPSTISALVPTSTSSISLS